MPLHFSVRTNSSGIIGNLRSLPGSLTSASLPVLYRKASFSFSAVSVSWIMEAMNETIESWKMRLHGISEEHLVWALALREVLLFWPGCSGWKHSHHRPESVLSGSKTCTLISLEAKISCNSLLFLSPGIYQWLFPLFPAAFWDKRTGLVAVNKRGLLHKTAYCCGSCIKSNSCVA